jgi:hypothetical protein
VALRSLRSRPMRKYSWTVCRVGAASSCLAR